MAWTKEDAQRLMNRSWDDPDITRKAPRVVVKKTTENFVSPVTREVITSRKRLEEHNRKNDVVNVEEFGTNFFERKKKEREKFFTEGTDRKERREQIEKTIHQLESKDG